MQSALQVWETAGMLLTVTVATGGTHGAMVIGIQGIGVKTPKAAAVAAATIGLDGVMHITKGVKLAMGILSFMVLAGMATHITLLTGSTL